MDGNSQKIKLNDPVSLLSIGHAIADMYSGFIIPILPIFAIKLNFNLPQAGLIIALTGLASSCLQPLYGFLSDKISKRFFIIWGLIIASVFISFTGHITEYYWLILFIVIGNVGVGLFHPQATAIVGKLQSLNPNLNMGIFVAGGIVGYALGPLISSAIVYYLDLHWLLIAIVPGLAFTLFLYLKLPKITVDKEFTDLKFVMTVIKRHKTVLIPLVLIIIIRSVVLVSLSSYLPFEWENNLGYSVLTVGIVMGIFSLVAGLASIFGGGIAGKYGEKKILIWSYLLPLPILIVSLNYLHINGIISFILYILGGAILLSTTSVTIVIAQRLLPDNKGVSSGITGGLCWGIAGLMMYPLGLLMKFYAIPCALMSITFLLLIALILIHVLPENIYDNGNAIKQ